MKRPQRVLLALVAALVAVALDMPVASASENPSGLPVGVGDTGLRTSISMSTDHSCALTDDGHLRCWGADGPAGGAPDGRVSEPNAATDETFTSMSTGFGQTCAVSTDGAIDCWGDDSNHQVSGPTTMADLGPIVAWGVLRRRGLLGRHHAEVGERGVRDVRRGLDRVRAVGVGRG